MAQQKDHIGEVNKMMTAVEWLVNQIGQHLEMNIKEAEMIIEQAKQMEKEQIVYAFDMGCQDENRIGDEYYNETYK